MVHPAVFEEVNKARKDDAYDPEKWSGFRGRYETELSHNGDLINTIVDKVKEGTVTLIYGARDEEHNEALVLKQYLEKKK